MSNLKENNDQNPDVRMAFEHCVSILGEGAIQAMMHELTVYARINFDAPSLSITKLYDGLEMLYGRQTAEMLAEELFLNLDAIAEKL